MKYIGFIVIFSLLISLLPADFRFAKELFEDGLYREALLEFEKIVQEKPTSIEAEQSLFLMGEAYRRQEQFAAAESSFLRLWNGYPNSETRDKTLLHLARVQMEQESYKSASENFQRLLNDFPMSAFTREGLVDYLKVLFIAERHEVLIVEANRMIQNYPASEHLPDIYLWLLQAYFAQNMTTEGDNTLVLLTQKYADSNAYWKAIEFETARLEEKKSAQSAFDFLNQKLQKTMPRQFEEPLRWKAAGLLFQLAEYEQAVEMLNEISSKFTFSAQFDTYLLLLMESQLKTNQEKALLSLYEEHKKRIENSPFYIEFRLYIAESHLRLNHYQNAESMLHDILSETQKDSLQYRGKKLLAKTFQGNNQAKSAIDLYLELTDKYSHFGKASIFNKHIADIYFHIFHNYTLAKSFYQKAANIERDLQAEILYQIALCEEQLGNYRSAYDYLSQIDENELKNKELQTQIHTKKDFLFSFQLKNYDSAIENLIIALFSKSEPQEKLIPILAEDLKQYEKALDLIEAEKSAANEYQRAKILLQLARKNNMLGNLEKAKQHTNDVSASIAYLNANTATQKAEEISLRLAYLNEAAELSSETVTAMKQFMQTYPQTDAANEFTYILANHYQKIDFSEAVPYLKALDFKTPLQKKQYLEAKINLAEYFYQNSNYSKAHPVYQTIADEIHLNRPRILFHSLVTQMELAKTAADTVVWLEDETYLSAQKKLESLVNNVHDFSDHRAALSYLANSFRNAGNTDKAITYTLRISGKQDEDYLTLSRDYLHIGNLEAAKEALLAVQEKDYSQLKQLAVLQFQTGDFSLAKYSFEQLASRQKNDADNYRYLGHIYFRQEDFTKAAEKLETYFAYLQSDSPFERAAQEFIISLFQIQNRPRAESVWKEYKRDLSTAVNQEIELYEAIYYKDINTRKADRIFASLIKDGNEDVRMRAYFWRGVSRLEQKKPAEAKNDFEKAIYADDRQIVNEANLKLGTIYFSEENYEQSLEHYYRVIQADETGDLALHAAQNFAFVCKTIEEWQKAIEAYEIILERWGDGTLQAQTLFDIAFCYFRDKKYERAIAVFNQTIPILQDKEVEAEAQYWIAESYAGAEQYERAITEFLKVSFSYSEYPHWAASAELRAGEAYIQLRQFDRAIRIYERVVSRYGRYSDWGKQAQERLNQLQ